MATNPVRYLVLAALAFLAFAMQGCTRNDSKRKLDKGEKLLESVLDAWMRGESPDQYAGPNQAIQANDPDWKAGYRLMSFLTVDSKQGAEGPSHIQCRVSLSLKDQKGSRVEKEVDYDVAIGDKTIIARVSH